MRHHLLRYAFAYGVISYMAGIVTLHALGLFPRAGLYDLAHLIGASQVTVEGEVMDSPVIRWDQTRFLLRGCASPLSAFCGKTEVTLAFPAPELGPGDRIRVRGWVSAPRAPSLRSDFDERGYLASRCVFSLLKVWSPESVVVVRRSSSWSLGRASWSFHRSFRWFWEGVLPRNEASLLLGITMGARGVLPAEIKDACIRAGVYHIVVVSGQNMSLIVSLGISVLLLVQIPKRYALWVCLFPILFYTSAVGSDPPVVRAAAMALIGLLTAALGRDIPRYYPLLLAAGGILCVEPEALLGASFQLSFGATLSILAFYPQFEGRLADQARWKRWFLDAGLLGLSVYVGLWPLLVYYFHRLSFVGLAANWTIFPLSGLLMILGLAVGTWGVAAPDSVPVWLVNTVRWMVHATLQLIWRMSAWNWAVRSVRPPAWEALVLYYGFLFGILFVLRRRKLYGQHHPSPQAGRTRLQRR